MSNGLYETEDEFILQDPNLIRVPSTCTLYRREHCPGPTYTMNPCFKRPIMWLAPSLIPCGVHGTEPVALIKTGIHQTVALLKTGIHQDVALLTADVHQAAALGKAD